MKTDPTKKAREMASQLSRMKRDQKVYINHVDGKYVIGKHGSNTVLVYKNGSEIAL